jgi:hypothetical protein
MSVVKCNADPTEIQPFSPMVRQQLLRFEQIPFNIVTTISKCCNFVSKALLYKTPLSKLRTSAYYSIQT